MSKTYKVRVTCGNCMRKMTVLLVKGTPLDQADWSSIKCSNCGTSELDPNTAKPC